jgi:hypothetical protein
MIIDGAVNETYFADRRVEGGDTWRSASLCCLRRTTILPKTITHVVVGTVTQGGDRVQSGAVGLCTAINGLALGIWDSACTVDEHGQVVVAIVNMTSDRFDIVSGDCVGSMSNSVFEADRGIHKLNDESVNTISLFCRNWSLNYSVLVSIHKQCQSGSCMLNYKTICP